MLLQHLQSLLITSLTIGDYRALILFTCFSQFQTLTVRDPVCPSTPHWLSLCTSTIDQDPNPQGPSSQGLTLGRPDLTIDPGRPSKTSTHAGAHCHGIPNPRGRDLGAPAADPDRRQASLSSIVGTRRDLTRHRRAIVSRRPASGSINLRQRSATILENDRQWAGGTDYSDYRRTVLTRGKTASTLGETIAIISLATPVIVVAVGTTTYDTNRYDRDNRDLAYWVPQCPPSAVRLRAATRTVHA